MTDKQIIDCEYSNVDEMRTCKAFDVSLYGDIICKEEDCIILKLEQQLKAKEQECEELKATLKVIADRPCLNLNDCKGNCLPHCKWNAHKLAQEALKELE